MFLKPCNQVFKSLGPRCHELVIGIVTSHVKSVLFLRFCSHVWAIVYHVVVTLQPCISLYNYVLTLHWISLVKVVLKREL